MNDARGSFDRIVHTVAILVLCFCVPAMIARILFRMLQKPRHRIKTGFDISDPVYIDEEVPIQGLRQGNGIAPTTSALISSKVFVDDADLVDGVIDVDTPGEDLIDRFQSAMDRWCGVIAPDKPKLFLIDFKWTSTDYVYRNLQEMPGEITLLDRNGVRIPLERQYVSVAAESLGV